MPLVTHASEGQRDSLTREARVGLDVKRRRWRHSQVRSSPTDTDVLVNTSQLFSSFKITNMARKKSSVCPRFVVYIRNSHSVSSSSTPSARQLGIPALIVIYGETGM